MKSNLPCRTCSFATAMVLASAVLFPGAGCDSHPQPLVTNAAAESAPLPKAAPAIPTASPTETSDPRLFATTGPLVAEQQADIAAERAGRVVNIYVRIGDHVRQGQLLAQLDDRALRSAGDLQKAHIASAQAQVRDWQAEELSVRADLRRADSMLSDKIISQENWEHVKYKLDETIAEGAHFAGEEAAAEAALNAANFELEQSRIVAPFSGVVGRSSVRPTQEVKPGDVLFWVTAESPLQVLFTVPETSMATFSVGKPLDLTTADFPGLHQAGRIARVSPVIDPASGSVQVIGAVVHPSPLLKPGMSMQVRLAP
jgi:RND family efflux transporter MFP subunit